MRDTPSADPLRTTGCPVTCEVPIRTLTISVVAVAAIAASLLLVKSRDENQAPADAPPGADQSARAELDALRAAGL
jgi:hypothetical protein